MNDRPAVSDAAKLRGLRIVWGAMLMGQLLFAAVATFIGTRAVRTGGEDLVRILLTVDGGLLVLCGGVALAVKLTTMGAASMDKYVRGTIVYLALLEVPSLMGVVVYLLGGAWAPALIVPGVAVTLQAVAFPRRSLDG